MKTFNRIGRVTNSIIAFVLVLMIISGCEFPVGSDNPVEIAQEIEIPDEPEEPASAPEESDVEVSSIEEPLVIVDYSQYTAIADKAYYKNKYLGEIFIIKDWQTFSPLTNTLTIYGKVPFSVHPDQSIEMMEFKNPNQPVIVTGFGEGWAKATFRGEGTGGSSVCTGEIKAEFKLIGGFYPAPRCTLDVDIVTTYILEAAMMHCVYDAGLELILPMDEWIDPFTDVKLPIVFNIPDGYVTQFAKTDGNVKYDLSYYLINFWGKPPSDAELALVFGDTPVQFFNTGCESVHLAVDQVDLAEEGESPPDVWDLMLTPESMRESPQP